MKEKDGTVRSGGEGIEELVAGEANGLGVVVLVGGRIDPDVPEDGKVVYCDKIKYQAYSTLREVSSNILHVGSLR